MVRESRKMSGENEQKWSRLFDGYGEPFPVASSDDKWVLRKLRQKSSKLISGMTGICIEFDAIG